MNIGFRVWGGPPPILVIIVGCLYIVGLPQGGGVPVNVSVRNGLPTCVECTNVKHVKCIALCTHAQAKAKESYPQVLCGSSGPYSPGRHPGRRRHQSWPGTQKSPGLWPGGGQCLGLANPGSSGKENGNYYIMTNYSWTLHDPGDGSSAGVCLTSLQCIWVFCAAWWAV